MTRSPNGWLMCPLILVGLVFGVPQRGVSDEAVEKLVNEHSQFVACTVLEIHDLDHIKIRTKGDGEIEVALACVIPFSAWPDSLNDERVAVQKGALDVLRDDLVGKEHVYVKLLRPSDDASQRPLVYVKRWAARIWHERIAPSRLGWGEVHYNHWVVGSGYSPWVRQVPALDRRSKSWPPDRWFREAVRYAHKHESGMWQSRAVVRSLEELAVERSDSSFTMSGLGAPEYLRLMDVIFKTPDEKLQVAAIRGLGSTASAMSKEDRRQIVERLTEGYQEQDKKLIKLEILAAIHTSRDVSEATHSFLKQVEQSESDVEIKEWATYMLRSFES